MNRDNEIQFKYLKTILSLDFNPKDNVDILRLFSEYISSNKNYKYNNTYLNDSISPFMETVGNIQNKAKKCEEFAELLSKKYDSLINWVIIIDNLFFIDSNFEVHYVFDLLKNPLYFDLRLGERLNSYNLYSQNKYKLVFNYICMNVDNHIEYTKRYSIAEISLFSLVKKTLIEKKEDEGN